MITGLLGTGVVTVSTEVYRSFIKHANVSHFKTVLSKSSVESVIRNGHKLKSKTCLTVILLHNASQIIIT